MTAVSQTWPFGARGGLETYAAICTKVGYLIDDAAFLLVADACTVDAIGQPILRSCRLMPDEACREVLRHARSLALPVVGGSDGSLPPVLAGILLVLAGVPDWVRPIPFPFSLSLTLGFLLPDILSRRI